MVAVVVFAVVALEKFVYTSTYCIRISVPAQLLLFGLLFIRCITYYVRIVQENCKKVVFGYGNVKGKQIKNGGAEEVLLQPSSWKMVHKISFSIIFRLQICLMTKVPIEHTIYYNFNNNIILLVQCLVFSAPFRGECMACCTG